MNNSNLNRKNDGLVLISDVDSENSDIALPVSSVSASAAAFSIISDSLRVLSAFAWGKEGRLSKKKSAQLCDLMNAWN